MSDATPIPGSWGLGGVLYDNNLHIYISGGGNVGFVPIQTSPKPWGPWTISGKMTGNPVPGANLGFTSPIPASVKAISRTKTQVTFAVTENNHVGGGSPGYVTYEITELSSPITDASLQRVTDAKALMTYTAPDSNGCTWEVSRSASYSPLVDDTITALLTAFNSDGGGTTPRAFVLGKRIVGTAGDSNNSSRALQGYTLHYRFPRCSPAGQ